MAGVEQADQLGMVSGVKCSICLDEIADDNSKGIAKLKCGHIFHLSCIGCEFNTKREMRCPNCRAIEDDGWQYYSSFLDIPGTDLFSIRNGGDADRYPPSGAIWEDSFPYIARDGGRNQNNSPIYPIPQRTRAASYHPRDTLTLGGRNTHMGRRNPNAPTNYDPVPSRFGSAATNMSSPRNSAFSPYSQTQSLPFIPLALFPDDSGTPANEDGVTNLDADQVVPNPQPSGNALRPMVEDPNDRVNNVSYLNGWQASTSGAGASISTDSLDLTLSLAGASSSTDPLDLTLSLGGLRHRRR